MSWREYLAVAQALPSEISSCIAYMPACSPLQSPRIITDRAKTRPTLATLMVGAITTIATD